MSGLPSSASLPALSGIELYSILFDSKQVQNALMTEMKQLSEKVDQVDFS